MSNILNTAAGVLLDAAMDTLYLVPFLFVTYLALEWLEHRAGEGARGLVRRAGAAGPAVGALLGAVPQCGFSAAAGTLYAGRVITLGTLFAVLLSTSDEMLPIFLAEQVPAATILRILGAKVAIGMAMGFAVDAAVRLLRRARGTAGEQPHIHDLCEHDHCHCGEAGGGIVRSALSHTLQVALFVFLVSLVLDAAIEAAGEDVIGAAIGANPTLAVFASALVGLIPNCAASVVIAQLYVDGLLGAGAMLAGLLVGAGVGLLVLVRTNRPARQNAAIVVALYAMGVAWGLVANVAGVVF